MLEALAQSEAGLRSGSWAARWRISERDVSARVARWAAESSVGGLRTMNS